MVDLGNSGVKATTAAMPLVPNGQDEALIGLLTQLKEIRALPPRSRTDENFPELVIKGIRAKKIKINSKPHLPNSRTAGSYSPLDNTLTVYTRREESSKHIDNGVMTHELYHAYQDAAKLPLRKMSEIEGPAYLLELRYLLKSKGHSKPSPETDRMLLQLFSTTRNYIFTSNQDRYRKIAAYALTDDRKTWNEGAAYLGWLFVSTRILISLRDGDLGRMSYEKHFYGRPCADLKVVLAPGKEFTIPKEQVEKLATLNAQAIEKKDEAPFVDYWLEQVSPAYKALILEADRASVVPNGI